ncbi:unnamed protein product [Phytophthora lilii]|uniref:Unnamed protein product n=1 Tax=Phytophthora lilii TaxID=2077276 RepID=A0A9W6U054_9STRA|nr:unnamed protein product [Phytophthora lilii]
MEPPSLLPHVDELVMEYLLFRGFTKTLQQLETSLLRLYVVNAVKSGHREKAAEFFQLHADKLNASVAAQGAGGDSWSRWFILPYIEHPENDAYFQVFFGQPWLEAFVTSFRNFLSLVFRNLPLPKLLAFQLARLEEPTLKLRLKVSQSEATRLRLYNSEATAKIKKLEEAGRQLHSILRMMVQHSFMEHFSASTPSYVEASSDNRNKSRSRSRSYGAATASVGLSHKQMKEIGELFGISSEENPHADVAPVDPRDIPRVAEVYLPVDELSDDEVLGPDDEEDEVGEEGLDGPTQEEAAGSDPPSPMFSPIVTDASPLAEKGTDGSVAKSSLTPIQQLPWSTDTPTNLGDNIRASLIREFNMLNDWDPTKSVMTARSRFSSDGRFLAIAKLGNTHIDIWSANPVVLSPASTIALPARLASLDWLGPGPSRQVRDSNKWSGYGVTMLWDTEGEEVISCPPNEDNLQARQLMCAREAPIAACLLTRRDEEETLQQVLVLHGGMEEPMQDYLPMEGKQLSCVAWSNMGNVLITGSETGNIEFIDVIRPERIHRCNLISCSGSARINGGNLSAICLSPDGTSMLSVHENGSFVMEWSVASILIAVASPSDAASDVRGSVLDVKPTLVFTYELDKPLVPQGAEVDNAIRFLAAGENLTCHCGSLDVKRGEKDAFSTFVPNQSAVADLDWHPKLPVCCSANQDGAISLWKPDQASSRETLPHSQVGTMNRRLAFDNRLCYERDVIRQQAIHQRKLEQVLPTSHSPSRVYLDSTAPVPQPHLATNAKRQQLERDRQLDIYHQNQRLASKMDQIMNRQENIVLAASSSSSRARIPQRNHLKPAESLMPRVPVTGAAFARANTGPASSPRFQSPRKPVHSPAHMHMPGIRLDATQTPLLDCHLSPEYAMGRGDACKKPTLVNRAVQKRRQNVIDQENRRLKERLAQLKPYYNTKKWDGEWQEHAHKFSHLRQDGTVGYLLPYPRTPSKRSSLPSRGGCKTSRDRGALNTRELPSLGSKNKQNASRAGRPKDLQNRQAKTCVVIAEREEDCEVGDDEDYPQVRELPPCLLLEATTRQGVEVTVNEVQMELIRSGAAGLGDRCVLHKKLNRVHGAAGKILVGHDQIVEVAQIVDDLEIMIKLETVSQIPKACNFPSLSTLLTDDELQKLLVGVVQQLRFQMVPSPPNASSSPLLLISWAMPTRRPQAPSDTVLGSSANAGNSTSPRRPRTCPSTIKTESEHQRHNSDIQDGEYQDDFNDDGVMYGAEADADPLELDWAIRFKTAALLNLDGRRRRTVLRKGSTFYLVSSWFEEESGLQTIKTMAAGTDSEIPLIEVTYSITEMEELLRQLEGGSLTVPRLLETMVVPLFHNC